MLGIDEGHVREVPRSDAHRLAAQGTTTATFHAAGDSGADLDHVEVVDAGEWCVLRYRGVSPGVTVVDPAALPGLARDLLDGGWEVDYEDDPPAWLGTAESGP